MRDEFIEWSARIGSSIIGKKKRLIDAFKLPGNHVSTWWFSLLSEKNPFKTDCFYQIAVVGTLKKVIKAQPFKVCAVCINDDDLVYALKKMGEHEGVSMRIFKNNNGINERSFNWRYWRELFKKMGFAGVLILGFAAWLEIIARAVLARCIIGDRSKRLPMDSSLMFVSYFPALDKEHQERGKFRNRYIGSLQDKLVTMDKVITWVMICAPIDGYSYRDALRFAKQFDIKGENIFILEEFLTVKDALTILLMWLRQSVVSLFLLNFAEKAANYGLIGDEFRLIFRKLWNYSFCGEIGTEGIAYYLLFRKVFKEIGKVQQCVYLCEMHAWEKALNAAKENSGSKCETIGFQYATVSRNYFNYFYHHTETLRSDDPLKLPIPDVLACNGKINQILFEEAKYPVVKGVEAVRQMYLRDIISNPVCARSSKPILLVAGSIDPKESMALVSLIHSAFPQTEGIDIWFKGHPIMPFSKLFEEKGIDWERTGYILTDENIINCLQKAWAVLVPTSTVAIEALAFGCEVIIPVLPNVIFMNPLADYEHLCHRVATPEELRELMIGIARRRVEPDVEMRRTFLEDYFFLDPELNRWENLLNPLKFKKCHGQTGCISRNSQVSLA